MSKEGEGIFPHLFSMVLKIFEFLAKVKQWKTFLNFTPARRWIIENLKPM